MIFCAVFLFLVSESPAFEESSANFLKYGIGAKNSAMGEVALTGSANITSSYWNPAVSAMSQESHFAAAYSQGIMDDYLAYVGAGSPFGRWFAGVSSTFEINEAMHYSEGGELHFRERAFSLISARKFLGSCYVGASLKLIHRIQDYPDFTKKDQSWAVDLGLASDFSYISGLTAGISLLNWGRELGRYGKLPRTLRVSGSLEREEFLIAADISRVLEGSIRLSGGVEYRMTEEFFLRTGYSSKDGGISGITYGIGIKSGNFQVDWASMPGGELMDSGRENRLSAIINF